MTAQEVERFALDLLRRRRVVPTIQRCADGTFAARWHLLLDLAEDVERLRALGASENVSEAELRARLQRVADAIARDAGHGFFTPTIEELAAAGGPGARAWLAALFDQDPTIRAEPHEIDRLYVQYRAWLAAHTPADVILRAAKDPSPLPPLPSDARWRVCFRLEAPETEAHAASPYPWTLRYLLQATDDPSLLIPAAHVWQTPTAVLTRLGRTLEQPQETLLATLARAAEHFTPIAHSLRAPRPTGCALTPEEARTFLHDAAGPIERLGCAVLVPRVSGEIGLRALLRPLEDDPDAGNSKTRVSLLGRRAVATFDWQIALGGEPLTREELESLVQLKTPLVKLRGQWVELAPDDLSRVDAILSHQPPADLTLLDALRLALSPRPDPADLVADLDSLPTEVHVTGWLEALIADLRSGAAAELDEPPGFVGQLRPYQKRGVAWLATLRRHGLGACLADDMGLGKCCLPDTPIFINGTLMRAEDAWLRFAGSRDTSVLDDAGEWRDPVRPVLTNALERGSGRQIVSAPITRFYRQRIQEPIRVITLDDGSQLALTRRHKLLGVDGWTNELRVGDHVGVASHLVWDGEGVDPDLVRLLAWQIAEGHESAHGQVSIAQSNRDTLESLRGCVERVADRNGLKINRPRVCAYGERAPYLRISSVAYERFLSHLGYQWGERSAGKRIPDVLVAADDATVRHFLREFFSAEASVVSSMRAVEVSSASRWLMLQLSTMLRRFGVWLRFKERQKHATNGSRIRRTYYVGLIGGPSLRRFCSHVGFADHAKHAKLEAICALGANTNVEGVPAGDVLIEMQRRTGLPRRHFGIGTVYFTGSQQTSKTTARAALRAVDAILSGEAEAAYATLPRSKWSGNVLTAYSRVDRQYLKGARSRLADLAERDVFHARIVSIQEIDYEGWVYDFEVQTHHSYVASGVLCHNTAQLIALLLHQPRAAVSGLPLPALVICPTSVVANWRRELNRFAPSLNVLVHHGAARQRQAFAQAAARHHVVISSYALLHRDADTFATMQWGDLILDEAQNVKNAATHVARAARRLRAHWRCALTGTPVENRLSDLWSIFQILNPGYLGSRESFQRRYAGRIERATLSAAATDSTQANAATRQLRALVSPFILRRLKTDPTVIQDLPEKVEIKTLCHLTREQATLYEAIVRDSLREIDSAVGLKRRGRILAALTKLKQVCDHPALFLHDESQLHDRSGKLTRLCEMLEEVDAAGERALIFTQYAEMGHLLKRHLETIFDRPILFLHGGTPTAQRQRLIDAFQSPASPDPDETPLCFVLSVKAGGTGLNLTAASQVFHFDRWWNPAVENQATDRAFRIGQTQRVQVYKYVCAGTFEEVLDEFITRKTALAESVVSPSSSAESWLADLSTDRLRDLLALRGDALAPETRRETRRRK